MSNKISFVKRKGKYLIFKEDGTSELFHSEEDFNKYLTDNKCEIIT